MTLLELEHMLFFLTLSFPSLPVLTSLLQLLGMLLLLCFVSFFFQWEELYA